MANKPNQRFPNCVAFVKELRAVLLPAKGGAQARVVTSRPLPAPQAKGTGKESGKGSGKGSGGVSAGLGARPYNPVPRPTVPGVQPPAGAPAPPASGSPLVPPPLTRSGVQAALARSGPVPVATMPPSPAADPADPAVAAGQVNAQTLRTHIERERRRISPVLAVVLAVIAAAAGSAGIWMLMR
jgi:hypothetical protein